VVKGPRSPAPTTGRIQLAHTQADDAEDRSRRTAEAEASSSMSRSRSRRIAPADRVHDLASRSQDGPRRGCVGEPGSAPDLGG